MNPLSSSTAADYRALSTAIEPSSTPYSIPQALQSTPLRSASSLVFIDSAVADGDFLAAHVTAGTEVHFLDPAQDAIAQITNTLLGREHIASIQVLSHGAAGGLQLGQNWLNLANLQSYATQLQSWKSALTDDADILLYGCNVAQGEVGKAFVQILSQLTGADVAASDNLTGNRALGGDWTLEYQFGSIEAAQAFLQPAEASYQGVLATFTVTNTNDSGTGSLRQAISDANALAGLDTIDFQIPGTGVQTINLASALPTLTDQVIINGYSQTGASQNTLAVGNNANLRIVLNGSGAGNANGIVLGSGAAGSTIQGLVIQNFQNNGIAISGGGNTIAGNFIGTDVTGTIDQGNTQQGISISGSNNVIGGTTAAARNVISGNNGVGIVFFSGSNTVQGNYIGTNAAGTQDLGNSFDGLQIQSGNNLIGGSAAGAGNVIAGNDRIGILLGGTNAVSNQIQGNFIGTDNSGTLSLGNSNNGIWLQSGASNTLIGGTATGAGNVIAFNTGRGVVVFAGTEVSNSILGNRMFSNTSLGIDLGVNGISANDVGDADTGPNNLQNFPVLTSVSSTTIQGRFNSTANTTFRIEFFANTTTDNEGEVYLGFQNVTTDASGNAVINYSYTAVAGKSFITATATNLTTSDTSEFSIVNQAPSLTADATLAAILEDATTISGATITSLFTGRFSDPDAGSSLSGVAIVGNLANASTQGTWQYSTDGGTTWFAIGTVGDDATALALSAATRLRFVPVADYNGTPPSLTVRAIDNTYSSFTTGATRVTVDASINGGQNALSATTRVIGTSVTAVNDQPSFTGSNQAAVAGSGAQTVVNWATGFDAGPADEDATQSVLSYEIVSNDNPALFATGGAPTIANNGTLTYTPGTTAGTATIQVRVRDTGGTANGGSDTSTIQTFTITINPQTVTLTAPDSTAAEGGTDNGTFRIARGTITGGALVVNLTIDGSSTTTSGDYTLSGGSVTVAGSNVQVTIPDGQSFVDVNLAAIVEAVGFAEAAETLRLNLTAGSYTLGASTNATVTITQNGFVVINTNDSGEGSLRQAVLNANALAGTDTITFAGATFTDATPDTITLTSGQLGIGSNVTITGTGANLLTISGNNASRVFSIGGNTIVNLNDLTIANGQSNNGGGIINSGNLTLTNSAIINGIATGLGGGIYSGNTAAVSLTLNNSTIANNTANNQGGGIHNAAGSLTINNSTISGNRALAGSGQGWGGGIRLVNGTIILSNSTVSSNSANIGGGLFSGSSGSVTLSSSTVTANTAASGGGVYTEGATHTVRNTLIAGNTGGGTPDVQGGFSDGGNNLIGKNDGSSGFTVSTLVGTITAPIDPQLGALANNGGSTQTHALLVGSLAINAGSNTGVNATDQTGNPRIVNSVVDIGAVESLFDRLSLTAQDAIATEVPGNPGVYRIQRGGSVGDLVVNLTIAGTSTASASDYTFSNNVSVAGSTLTVTIPDGQNFVDLTLTPVLDTIVEATETVTLNLASGNYGINPAQITASVDIIDAPVLSITATDATGTELPGNPGTFRITRTGDPSQALVVNYTVSGTATNGTDYTTLNGTATILAGQSFVDVTLTPVIDTLVEGTETVVLTLAAGDYAISPTDTATVNILDAPVLSITATDATATELPGNPGTFRITRTGDPSQALVVNYTVSGTATNGTDYTTLNGTATILAGQTFVDVLVDPIADTVVESSETVVMTLATGDYAISATDTATVNILDAPVLSITATDATATELPGNPGSLRITRTGDPSQALVVNYTVSGTATNGSDYTTLTRTATIAAGQTFVDVTLAPVNDNLVEGTETVVLTLAAGEYVVSATNAATVDIIDAPIVTVAVPDASASESAPNSGTFRITRTGDTGQALTVNYTIAGTAANGSDYATLTSTATILAGQTFVDVLINPINDSIAEVDETIQLNLTTGDYNLGSTTSGTVTLLANDPTIRITPVTVSQFEGDIGISYYTFTVELSNPSDEVVTVNYATTDGTATTADNDYIANSGTLTFNPGVTSQTVTIAVNGDTTFEADQTFQVDLSAATNGTLSTTAKTATGLIVNDDAIPVYTFSSSNYRALEGNGLNIIPLAITRSGNLSQTASVQVQLSNGSAIAGRDFVGGVITVSFAVGQAVAYIPVQILGNRRSESNKTLNLSFVGLSEAGRYGDQAQASLTIINDDPTSRKIFHKGKGRSGIKSKTSKHRKLKRRK